MSRSRKEDSVSKNRNRRRQQNKACKASGSKDAGWNSGASSPLWTAMRSARGRNWLFVAALVAAVFLAYQPAWHGGFVWDDDLHLLNNPVLKPGGLLQTWVPGTYVNYWPLTFTVYRLEFEMWGLNPLGFHLVNIALHVVSALLMWRILEHLRIPGAMLAAALFALHPVNVESVAWIAQLKNTLSLALALLSLLFYLLHERDGGRWRFALSLTFFLLSAFSKGMALTLPAVLLACTWWQQGCLRWRDMLRILPYLPIGMSMAGMEVGLTHAVAGETAVRSDSLLSRAAIAGCAVWFYFWKLIWPANLVFIYPRWNISERDLSSYLPGVLLVVILSLAWWQRRSWGRPVTMLMVCYVALLLPVLGFVNITFMEYSLVADHWQYAATIVPCAAFAGLAATLGRRLPRLRFGGCVLCLGLLAMLAALTFAESRTYKDIETLYRTTLDRNPNCWLVHDNFGVVLMNRGRTDLAIEHFEDALAINPDCADVHCNLGVALMTQGQTDLAIEHYEKALKIKHDYADAHCNLGVALAKQGRIKDAIAHYHEALGINRDDSSTLNNLAWLRATYPKAAFRDGTEAVELAQRASHLSDGRDPAALDTLAAAYAEAGRFPEAVQTAQKAIDLAKRQNNEALAGRVKARLRLYEARTPYREHSSGPTAQ